MAFYRRIRGRLMIGGTWVDITSDIRANDQDGKAITITRGQADEQRRVTPSKCTLQLKNHHRNYSRRNPYSPYYKQLGTNTPLVIDVLLAEDVFDGTTSNGWGSADPVGIRDSAYPWSIVGTAADFAEAAGAATHTITAANVYHYSYLADVVYADVGVYTECTVAVNNVTGGAIEPATILLRGVGTNPTETYYQVRVTVSTAEVLTVSVLTEAGTVVAAAVTVSGVVDAVSSKLISIRAECEGELIRVRVWKTGTPEPGAWHIATESRTYLTAGWVGVRSGVATGNTNTPVAFSYNTVQVYSLQFAGEIAKFPQTKDRSGNLRTIPVTAWDVFQRIKQGQSPVKSALRRGILSLATPAVAYWPCEDGAKSGSIASDSVAPAMTVTGQPTYASNNDFDCSLPIPVFASSAWTGTIPLYDNSAGQTQIRFLLSVPSGGDTDGITICRIWTLGGTTGFWDVVYGSGSGGTLTLNIYDPAGALLHTSGPVGFSLNGTPVRLGLSLTQNGANIDWALNTIRVSDGLGGGISNTLAGRTFGRFDWIYMAGNGLVGTAMGHILVQNVVNDIYTLYPELIAYAGDRTQARVAREAAAAGIPVFVGQGTTGAQTMGAQRPVTLQKIFDECTDADLGGLSVFRGYNAIRYDRLNYLYNQAVAVTLDYANHELTDADPVDDNFLTRNDITVRRPGGSEYHVTQLTGPLAAVDPIDGGIGVYDDTPSVNVKLDSQLPDAGDYRLLRGTIDQPRFPELVVSFGTGAVRASEATTRKLFDLNLWQRVQIAHPSGMDLYDTVDQLLVGQTVTLGRFIHQLALNTVPYDPYRILELDNSTYDALSSDATTLNEDLTTAETGVDIAISDGVLWSTDAADYPIDIAINGERMTVTAVSGSSSPQTLTVTRAVNGVVLEHATGDAVDLADPVYVAGW